MSNQPSFLKGPEATAWAATLLRISLGIMFLAHGLTKLLVFTLPGTAKFFASVGFPAWTAYVVGPFEVLAGVALIVGLFSRWVALVSVPVLLGALSVHASKGWSFSAAGGGWEYPAFLVVAAVAVFLLGSGKLAISGNK